MWSGKFFAIFEFNVLFASVEMILPSSPHSSDIIILSLSLSLSLLLFSWLCSVVWRSKEGTCLSLSTKVKTTTR